MLSFHKHIVIKTISKIPHTRLSDIAVMPQFSFKMQKMAKNSPEVMQHSVIDMRCFRYVDGIKIFILSCTCMLIYVYSSKRLFHCRIRSDSYKVNATTTITLYYMRTVFQQWRHSTYRINYMYKVLQKLC